MNEKLPNRKRVRAKYFNYSQPGVYFITICTQNRQCVLSKIVGTGVPTAQNSTLSRFVSTFKRFCNKEIGQSIWQSRSYDHIVRNDHDYIEISKYIEENPLRWQYDKLYENN